MRLLTLGEKRKCAQGQNTALTSALDKLVISGWMDGGREEEEWWNLAHLPTGRASASYYWGGKKTIKRDFHYLERVVNVDPSAIKGFAELGLHLGPVCSLNSFQNNILETRPRTMNLVGYVIRSLHTRLGTGNGMSLTILEAAAAAIIIHEYACFRSPRLHFICRTVHNGFWVTE